MFLRRRPFGAIALIIAVSLAIDFGVAAPALADQTYPSWHDVLVAKKSVKAKRAEIAKLQNLIAGLEAKAADAGRVALVRGEEYQIAQQALDDATATANQLSAQADAAQSKATASSQQAGQLVAQMARSGGSNLTINLLLDGSGAGDLLDRLGTMSKLSEQATQIYRRAQVDANSSRALTDQAKVAQAARQSLAETAQGALAAAQSAAADAQSAVSEQKKQSQRLYAQLASLRGTTASVEKRYLEGVAWEKAQEAVKNPPQPAPPVNPTPPPPNSSAVAGAIAFARAQLGEPYVLGGMGPNVWDCSGLTKAAYASVGVYIGTHSATDQFNTMRREGRLVPLNQMVAGDLLWYSGGGSTSATKYHTTLYIGGGEMIEAPYPGQVVRIRPVRYGDLVPYAGRPTP